MANKLELGVIYKWVSPKDGGWKIGFLFRLTSFDRHCINGQFYAWMRHTCDGAFELVHEEKITEYHSQSAT